MAAQAADFEFGQEYELRYEPEFDAFIVRDAQRRMVAMLPRRFQGVVRTRLEAWRVDLEHHQIGWSLVAVGLSTEVEAARIKEGLVPEIFKITVADGSEFHVNCNPLTHTCTLHADHSELARITGVGAVRAIARGDAPQEVQNVGAITTSPPRGNTPVALAILLTLQMCMAEAALRLRVANLNGPV